MPSILITISLGFISYWLWREAEACRASRKMLREQGLGG